MTQTIKLSPNRVDIYCDCPRKYWYHYFLGWRKRAKAATLLIGTILNDCCDAVVKAKVLGVLLDPVTMFRDAWRAAQGEHEIEYTTTQSPEKIEATGMRLMEMFPDVWDRSRLTPVLDSAGEPFIERKLSASIGDNVTLMGIPDILVMSLDDGSIGKLDFKAPESPYDPISIWQSDQLTHYQILGDANAEQIGIERVDWLSFMQLIRRPVPKRTGKGPEVLLPGRVERRTDIEIQDYKRKVLWVADNIRKGCFPKNPRKPHNTPCTMCDYAEHCVRGATDGLILPESQQAALI